MGPRGFPGSPSGGGSPETLMTAVCVKFYASVKKASLRLTFAFSVNTLKIVTLYLSCYTHYI